MTPLFWVAGALVVLMLVPAAVFYVLYLGTSEPVARERAMMFWRFGVLVVLATLNIAVFKRVFEGVAALF